MAEEKSKREIVLEALQAGGATMESLMAAADCKYASIMSIFSTLRLMGHYPVKDVENPETKELTYRLVDAEEWEAIKAERAEKAKAKREPALTPEQQIERAKKTVARTEKAMKAAIERANKNEDSELLQLRAEKAQLEFRIAEIVLAELQDKFAE